MSEPFSSDQAFELLKSLAEGGCIHLRGVKDSTDIPHGISNAQFDAQYLKNLYHYLTGKDQDEALDAFLKEEGPNQ